MGKTELLENIEKIHTTEMGIERIKKNLDIDASDVVSYCKNIIKKDECIVNKIGKNFYCQLNNYFLTINSYSYTIITAHKS